jgi:hypothetical protein
MFESVQKSADEVPTGENLGHFFQLRSHGPGGVGSRRRNAALAGATAGLPSVHTALHRLETRKLLAADWRQTASGRDAKFYRLTRSGRARLEAETANWTRLSETIGLILAMPEGGAQ